MNHFKSIGQIIFGAFLLTCRGIFNLQLKAETNHRPNLLSERSLKFPETGIINIVKLHPFEILFREVISYADVTLHLANNQNKTTEITVDAIEIVDLETDRVLLSNKFLMALKQPNPIQSKLPKPENQSSPQAESFTLAPKEKITLNFRLKSFHKIYQRGMKVYTKVHYRQDQQLTKKVISSVPEKVAFTIP